MWDSTLSLPSLLKHRRPTGSMKKKKQKKNLFQLPTCPRRVSLSRTIGFDTICHYKRNDSGQKKLISRKQDDIDRLKNWEYKVSETLMVLKPSHCLKLSFLPISWANIVSLLALILRIEPVRKSFPPQPTLPCPMLLIVSTPFHTQFRLISCLK